MALKQRYVIYGALRFTWGMGMFSMILAVAIFYSIYLYVNRSLIKQDNIPWIVGFFVVIGIFTLFAIYTDKTQRWPYYILEVYDDGWMRYIMKYEDEDNPDEYYISPDTIIGIGPYRKKYYPKKGKWFVDVDFGFMVGKKVYGLFLSGWLEEPEDIKDFEELINWFIQKGKENLKRLGIDKLKHITWFGIMTLEKDEKTKEILKEEWEKHKKESAEQVSQ